jgi:uncharacterized protein
MSTDINIKDRSRTRRWVMVIVAAMAITVGFALYTNLAREARKEATTAAALQPLEVATSNGTRRFMVEVMKTDEDRAKGLMFRQFLPEDRGMLFDFLREQPVAMWMRNTYIPLDMLFIRANGVVHRVHERAVPLDETTIEAGAPVRFVLEINGGIAAKHGIKAGDKVLHEIIPR